MKSRYKPESRADIGSRGYYGKTITEAKQARADAVAKAFTGDYIPHFIHYRGVICLIYRDIDGWLYRAEHLQPNPHGDRHLQEGELADLSSFEAPGGNTTFEEAAQRALMTLAQWTWTHEDGESYLPPFLTNKQQQTSFQSWCRFQRDYRKYRAEGYNDCDSHRLACGWGAN